MVAPVVTYTLVVLATSARNPAFALFALQNAGDLRLFVLFAVLALILYGFVGSFLFLGVGFSALGGSKRWRKNYALIGAFVGLVHTTLGLALSEAYQHLGPGTPWELFLDSIQLIGGFLLLSSQDLDVTVTTFVAAPVGGAAAGLLYSRIRSTD